MERNKIIKCDILPTTQSSYRESMTGMTIEILIIEKRVRPGVPKGSAYPSLSTVSGRYF
jgi:hypothetical protein